VAELKKEKKETVVRSGSTKRKARDDEAQDSGKVCLILVDPQTSTNRNPGAPAQGPQSLLSASSTCLSSTNPLRQDHRP
jgi:hypothetical protein